MRPSAKVRREFAATIKKKKKKKKYRISLRGAVTAFLGAESAAGYMHPALGEALAVADVIMPAIVLLVLLTAILRGSAETCDRVFRLLRWIVNCPSHLLPPTEGEIAFPPR